MLSSLCFQYFILHHFTTGNHIVGPCTSSMLMLQGSIPHGVQNRHRSVQIASNSVRTYKGPVAIDVFTEIQLYKVSAHFPLDCTIIACNPCSILPIHDVPPISPLAVLNCLCLTQTVSLCGRIKRRRMLTLLDDRTKLTNGCSNLAPPTSPAVFKTARVRLFATHSHHPLVV